MSAGRGKSRRSLELIEACIEILREIQPASVRAVCYRLFTLGLIGSMEKINTNRVGRQLTDAREGGMIPWAWIVDETRAPERVPSWKNPAAFVRTVRNAYRRDHWALQPYHVEVWSEKGTVRGTLGPVLDEYGITFRVMHGFGSATVVHDIAEASREIAQTRPCVALYVGDFDPSGMSMSEQDLPTRLAAYDGEVTIRRVALLAEDLESVETFRAATKTADPRHVWFVRRYGVTCAELDALSPVLLRQRVQRAIESYIDPATWQRSLRAAAAETSSLHAVLDTWHGAVGASA